MGEGASRNSPEVTEKKIKVQNAEANSGNKLSQRTCPRNKWRSVQRVCISVVVLALNHTALWYQLISLLLSCTCGQYVILEDVRVATKQ